MSTRRVFTWYWKRLWIILFSYLFIIIIIIIIMKNYNNDFFLSFVLFINFLLSCLDGLLICLYWWKPNHQTRTCSKSTSIGDTICQWLLWRDSIYSRWSFRKSITVHCCWVLLFIHFGCYCLSTSGVTVYLLRVLLFISFILKIAFHALQLKNSRE